MVLLYVIESHYYLYLLYVMGVEHQLVLTRVHNIYIERECRMLDRPRGPPRTKSGINKDFKSLGFSNLKSQNFLKISKF